MPFFERFTKDPGPDWVVTIRVTRTVEVSVFGGDEERARQEANLAIDAEDDEVVEILSVEQIG